MKFRFYGVAVLVAVCSCTPNRESTGPGADTPTSNPHLSPEGSDRADLSRLRSTFSQAVNEETVDQWALAALAKGANIMPPGRPSISNREEIRAWIRRLLDQYQIEHFQLTTEEIVEGDWAYEKGVYLLEARPAEGGEKIQQRGKVLFIWKRGEGGQWEGVNVSFNNDGYWP